MLPAVHVLLRVVAGLALLVVVGIGGFNLVTFAVAFRRGPRPPRLLLAVMKELLATLCLVPLVPFRSLVPARYQPRQVGDAAREGNDLSDEALDRVTTRPVILLHGYLMNRTNWVWLGAELARRGLGPLVAVEYDTLGTIAAAAERLHRAVERLCESEPAAQVDIVAHSLGGLVARRYIERLGGAARVGRLITLGTPHHGTRWARAASGRSRGDLFSGASGSPQIEERDAGVRYTSIWSRCDQLIVPPESSRLPERLGGDEVVFDDLGHMGLLASPRVADAIAGHLAARS